VIRSWSFVLVCFLFLFAGCSKSTDDLVKDLSDNSPITRSMAATTLSGMHDRASAEKLIALLNSKEDRLVFIVAQILGSRADTLAIRPLAMAAKHPNSFIRAKAVWSIGSIGHASGLPYLVEACKDSTAVVRHSAVMAIGFLHYPPAAATLYPMLRDPADSVRTAAIQSIYAFRKIEGSGVLAADLAIALNDPAPVVRYVAVQALGGGFPDTTVAGDLLIEALRDENKNVRVESITSLKNIGYKKAVPILKKMFDTASVDEEYAISEAIKGMTGETYPPETGK
jgi:HEAT repeat protein